MKISDISVRAKPLIKATLQAVPAVHDVHIEEEASLNGDEVDLLVKVRLNECPDRASAHVLVVAVKANGQPRWAKAAADQLARNLQLLESKPKKNRPYGVFIAPYVSEAAAKVLRERGLGYLDLAGNGRLAFGSIYVERTGNPNRFSERSELRTLFSPKASRVLRVLLLYPNKPWRMAALADEADVSLGLVAKVKPLLLDREWAVETSVGLALTDPGSALETWAANFRRRREHVHDYYGFGSIKEIEDRLVSAAEAAGVRYGLAEFSGAERFAPHVRYGRVGAYVEAEGLEDVARRAELRSVTSGPNVRLFEPYDEGVFTGAQRKGEAVVAHPLQLYLDLKQATGRGEEAADFLRRQILEPAWKTE